MTPTPINFVIRQYTDYVLDFFYVFGLVIDP